MHDDEAIPAPIVDWVERLHALVDEATAPVARASARRLSCRPGCAECCVDGLTVFAIEAAVLRRHYPELFATAEPHAPGACALLGEDGRCRVYEHRPYVCRTQGLPLRWLEQDEPSGEIVEARDICPKNVAGGPPLEELTAEECWALGPFEDKLAEIQARVDGGRGTRIALRSLFSIEARRRLPVHQR